MISNLFSVFIHPVLYVKCIAKIYKVNEKSKLGKYYLYKDYYRHASNHLSLNSKRQIASLLPEDLFRGIYLPVVCVSHDFQLKKNKKQIHFSFFIFQNPFFLQLKKSPFTRQ